MTEAREICIFYQVVQKFPDTGNILFSLALVQIYVYDYVSIWQDSNHCIHENGLADRDHVQMYVRLLVYSKGAYRTGNFCTSDSYVITVYILTLVYTQYTEPDTDNLGLFLGLLVHPLPYFQSPVRVAS